MQTVLKPKACSLPHAISQHHGNAGLRWTPPALDTKSENVGVDQQNVILIEKSPNSELRCASPGLPVPLTSSVSRGLASPANSGEETHLSIKNPAFGHKSQLPRNNH